MVGYVQNVEFKPGEKLVEDNGTWLAVYYDYDPDDVDPQREFLIVGEKGDKTFRDQFSVSEISSDTIGEILKGINKSTRKFLEL